MYRYEATCDCPAPVEGVWAILSDLPGYSSWNPFTRRMEAALVVGSRIRMRVDLGWITVTQVETIRAVEPPSRLVWALDDWPRWLLWAERVQTLTPVEGGARYHTVDTIGGALAPVVHLLFGAALRRGFAAMAEGLARAVAQSQP